MANLIRSPCRLSRRRKSSCSSSPAIVVATAPAAVYRLSKDLFYNALLRTACVATMLKAGHGPSALPQRAEATINCRIVPGQTSAWLMNTLREAVADGDVAISGQFTEPSDPPASPLRPDVFSAAKKGVDSMWPGVTVLPGMMT